MGKSFLILGVGIWTGAILGITAHELRRRRDRRELKEDVLRWEEEGGKIGGHPASRHADAGK